MLRPEKNHMKRTIETSTTYKDHALFTNANNAYGKRSKSILTFRNQLKIG